MKDQLLGGNNKPQFSLTPQIITQSKTVTCECGGMLFTEKMVFKKLSALISPSGNEEIIPMNTFICDKCGKIPSVFDPNNVFPEELKTKKITL